MFNTLLIIACGTLFAMYRFKGNELAAANEEIAELTAEVKRLKVTYTQNLSGKAQGNQGQEGGIAKN